MVESVANFDPGLNWSQKYILLLLNSRKFLGRGNLVAKKMQGAQLVAKKFPLRFSLVANILMWSKWSQYIPSTTTHIYPITPPNPNTHTGFLGKPSQTIQFGQWKCWCTEGQILNFNCGAQWYVIKYENDFWYINGMVKIYSRTGFLMNAKNCYLRIWQHWYFWENHPKLFNLDSEYVGAQRKRHWNSVAAHSDMPSNMKMTYDT